MITKSSALSIGLDVDIRDLEYIAGKEKILIVLYFEKDLVENSTYEKDLRDFGGYNEDERPFILVEKFLKFQREMSPVFDDALDSVPLVVKIVKIGSHDGKVLVTALLPFLDEMTFED